MTNIVVLGQDLVQSPPNRHIYVYIVRADIGDV